MTTARQVITRAAQIVAEVSEGQVAPKEYFANEVALPRLNGMIKALFGRLVGPPLTGVRPTSSRDVQSGARYFVGTAALTLTLPTCAQDGDYFGVADTNAGLASANVTIARNAWLLEGSAADLTLNTNGTSREWFFRADTGNWQRVMDLGLDDLIYFPDDIIHGLAPMLAAEVLPVGYAASDILGLQNNAAREKIAQRYAWRAPAAVDDAIQAIQFTQRGFNITTGI